MAFDYDDDDDDNADDQCDNDYRNQVGAGANYGDDDGLVYYKDCNDVESDDVHVDGNYHIAKNDHNRFECGDGDGGDACLDGDEYGNVDDDDGDGENDDDDDPAYDDEDGDAHDVYASVGWHADADISSDGHKK